MFIRPKSKSQLQFEMEKLLFALGDHDPTSDEFETIVDRLSELHKIEQDQKPSRISPDTRATILANLLGIVMIIRHEEANFIASKALSFVPKLR